MGQDQQLTLDCSPPLQKAPLRTAFLMVPSGSGAAGLKDQFAPVSQGHAEVAAARCVWWTPELPGVAELARLAVGEEEVVGEEDRLRLTGGLLCRRSVGSGVVDREGGIGDAGGVGGGGWRGLRGRGGVGQALHRTCKEKRWPRLSRSGAR